MYGYIPYEHVRTLNGSKQCVNSTKNNMGYHRMWQFYVIDQHVNNDITIMTGPDYCCILVSWN